MNHIFESFMDKFKILFKEFIFKDIFSGCFYCSFQITCCDLFLEKKKFLVTRNKKETDYLDSNFFKLRNIEFYTFYLEI